MRTDLLSSELCAATDVAYTVANATKPKHAVQAVLVNNATSLVSILNLEFQTELKLTRWASGHEAEWRCGRQTTNALKIEWTSEKLWITPADKTRLRCC